MFIRTWPSLKISLDTLGRYTTKVLPESVWTTIRRRMRSPGKRCRTNNRAKFIFHREKMISLLTCDVDFGINIRLYRGWLVCLAVLWVHSVVTARAATSFSSSILKTSSVTLPNSSCAFPSSQVIRTPLVRTTAPARTVMFPPLPNGRQLAIRHEALSNSRTSQTDCVWALITNRGGIRTWNLCHANLQTDISFGSFANRAL